jgi:dTDP-4-dehydrorhamnose reductase
MRLVVLGARGQVGAALAARLPDAVALGRAEADLEVPGLAAAKIRSLRPEVVINAAACTAVDKAESEPERAMRVNAEAVGEIAAAAADVGAWLIHYSTDYVFDGSGSAPHRETDPTGPLNVYGRSKLGGEQAALRSGASALILRTSWVHGRGGNNFVSKILSLAQSRETLSVIDDQVGAPTSADLIAAVTLRAVDAIAAGRPIPSGIYHLAAAGETSFNGYARFIVTEALSAGLPLRAGPDRIAKVPSSAFPSPATRPLNSRLATDKLRAALGIALPDWREGVRDTLAALLPEKTR